MRTGCDELCVTKLVKPTREPGAISGSKISRCMYLLAGSNELVARLYGEPLGHTLSAD